MDLNNECITRTPNCGQGFNNRADHWTDGSGHSKKGLLLASLYDAGQYAERVAMKLDFVATALRRQFISYDSATSCSQISVCSTTFFERNFPMRRFDDRLTIK